MAHVRNAYRFNCPPKLWEKAMTIAEKRVDATYPRDFRIRYDREKRKGKIAIGIVGEYALEDWFDTNGLNVSFIGDDDGGERDADFQANNTLIDIRTQEVFRKPDNDWRCEITSAHRNGNSNILVFAKMIHEGDYRTVLVLGWLSRPEFNSLALHTPAGTILKGRPVAYSKWDVTIEQLHEMNTLVPKL